MLIPTDKEKSSKLTIGYRCGDCIHFEKDPKFAKVCSKMDEGITRKTIAPPCFDENVFELQRVTSDTLNQIGILAKSMTVSQSRILTAVLLKKKTYQRYGLAFGLPVFVCMGDDYLSNYYKGFVCGVSRHGAPVISVTTDLQKKQVTKPAIMRLMPESVFTITAWKKKRAKLIEGGRLSDPRPSIHGMKVKKKRVDEDYEPPSLETAPEEWFDSFAKRAGKDVMDKKVKRKKYFNVEERGD